MLAAAPAAPEVQPAAKRAQLVRWGKLIELNLPSNYYYVLATTSAMISFTPAFFNVFAASFIVAPEV